MEYIGIAQESGAMLEIPAPSTSEEYAAYINAASTREERQLRKMQMYAFMYSSGPLTNARLDKKGTAS